MLWYGIPSRTPPPCQTDTSNTRISVLDASRTLLLLTRQAKKIALFAMPSALFIMNRAPVNGYTGTSSTANPYWSSGKTNYPMYQTFSNEVYNYRSIQKQNWPVSQPLAEGTDRNLRDLRAAVYVDDGLDEISYPIATTDTCDCVAFPSDGFTLAPCSGDAYWGAFQVKFTDGTCYDVTFDETIVYENCPSGQSSDAVTEAVLCEVDFTEGTDTPEDLPTSSGGFSSLTTSGGPAAKAKTTAPTDQATTPSLRHESAPGAKKTRIHLSVHRLLTLVVEAVFALQYPST
ncbi:hypothetical protein PHYPSEUDO_010296 [Phytophthora pseudosyringae]|uniref:Uncharacterized protein n=1 Tax=Phytophthora pseudosyringae TaxID=221518 RepID=A0A8T1VAE8_9STRA|nr:hypothetical protein PHYPSEUDO_010296 [Phytophthora pseudosyringae]